MTARVVGTGWVPPCPIHALTGLDCPGCGSTRAMQSLIDGDIARAVSFNALAIVAAGPVLMWCWWAAMRRRPLPLVVSHRLAGTVWAIVVGVYTIARNLPVPGLRALAA
ncbi:MAG: DUF2752 domain-containing protein [Desertimonas sp.]